jgi:hypothetical protein
MSSDRYDFGAAIREQEEDFNRKMALDRFRAAESARAEIRHAAIGLAMIFLAAVTAYAAFVIGEL